ncbi:MAG: HD domain-containing protein [Lachnospiraceae bacterium]|nr:HD domain-containing protein [Lachnospiraceae bacterium]
MKNRVLSIIISATVIAGTICSFVSPDVSAASPTVSITGTEKVASGLEGSQMAILYDSSIGMPTSEANAIAQTADGFIWIGSYSGLVRYDGNSFYRFDSSVGISSVVSLYVDSQDRLWIGTNDNGLAMYKNGSFSYYNTDTALESASIRSITEDEAGNILVATTHGAYYIGSDDALNVIDDSRINDMYIYAMHTAPSGITYANSVSGDVVIIDHLSVTGFIPSSGIDFFVNSIYPDPQNPGYIYIGTDDMRIFYCQPTDSSLGKPKVYRTPDLTSINNMLYHGGQLWVCADDGIGYFDENMKFKKLNSISMTSSVDYAMVDYEDNLWFTSSRQGVMKLTRSIFTDVNRYDSLPEMVVNTTCIFNDRLYVGTDNGLLVLNNKLRKVPDPMTDLLAGIRIRSIKADSNGHMWICTYSDYGLICMNSDGSYTCFTAEKDGLASDKVRTCTELNDGSIAASASGCVAFIRDGNVISTFSQDHGLVNTEILTICENVAEDKLYLGSDGDGIYILDPNSDEIGHLGHQEGLTSDVVLRIKHDPYRDVYWVITSNSIAYIKDGKITTVTGFPYANNFDIFFNEHGELWVLSSAGVFVVNADDMIANRDIVYEQLDSESGLPYVTTANSRSYIDDAGMLYISGTAGITMVNINDRTDDLSSIKLAIPFVEADDEVVFPDEEGHLEIPATCKRLTIHAYALSYSLNNPKVKYYLEGFDDSRFTTTKREMTAVTYTNLNGGNYTFHLELMGNTGQEPVKTADLSITKQMAWYEYFWVRALITVLLASAVILIIAMYFKRKSDAALKKQQETRQLINEITKAFAKTIDMKDRYTNGHSFRVANYTRMLARKLGYNEDQVADMYNIALLHDIGKLAIPDAILNKPEGLDDEEYAVMKSHAAKGYEVLKEITIAPDLAIGAGYHHERLDGKGYPNGLGGEDIPFVAQIIAVADTFDAMYSTRPYRKQLPLQTVLDELQRVAGTQLNADVVAQLVSLAEEGQIK